MTAATTARPTRKPVIGSARRRWLPAFALASSLVGCATPPLQTGNLLVSENEYVHEFALDGSWQGSVAVPYPGGTRPAIDDARGLVLDRNGAVRVFNGTLDPHLSTYVAATDAWSHATHPGWKTYNNGTYGSVATVADNGDVFATNHAVSASSNEGVLAFDESASTSATFGIDLHPIDLTLGQDGLLYALHPPGSPGGRRVDVFHPTSRSFLRRVELVPPAGQPMSGRAVAVDAAGEMYVATWQGDVVRFAADGTAIETHSFTCARWYDPSASCRFGDIDIAPDGRLAVGSADGEVILTDTGFSTSSQFHAAISGSSGGQSVFVAFVHPPPDAQPVPGTGPNLSIEKSDPGDPFDVNDTVVYLITVSNAGADPATGVVVTDTHPPGIAPQPAQPTGGCTATGPAVECLLGTLDPGEHETLAITATATTPGTHINTARVTANEADANPLDNATSEATTVEALPAPSPAITVTKTSGPLVAGGIATFRIEVANSGPVPLTDVTLTDVFTTAGRLDLSTPSVAPCTVSATLTTITTQCALGALPVGASVTVVLSGKARTFGDVSNTAYASAAEMAPNAAVFQQDFVIEPVSDVELVAELTATKTSFQGGTNVLHTARITNAPGAGTASGINATLAVNGDVTLPTALPPGVPPMPLGCAQIGTAPAFVVSCGIATIAPGAEVVIPISVHATGVQTVQGTLTVETFVSRDANPGNDTAVGPPLVVP